MQTAMTPVGLSIAFIIWSRGHMHFIHFVWRARSPTPTIQPNPCSFWSSSHLSLYQKSLPVLSGGSATIRSTCPRSRDSVASACRLSPSMTRFRACSSGGPALYFLIARVTRGRTLRASLRAFAFLDAALALRLEELDELL